MNIARDREQLFNDPYSEQLYRHGRDDGSQQGSSSHSLHFSAVLGLSTKNMPGKCSSTPCFSTDENYAMTTYTRNAVIYHQFHHVCVFAPRSARIKHNIIVGLSVVKFVVSTLVCTQFG